MQILFVNVFGYVIRLCVYSTFLDYLSFFLELHMFLVDIFKIAAWAMVFFVFNAGFLIFYFMVAALILIL